MGSRERGEEPSRRREPIGPVARRARRCPGVAPEGTGVSRRTGRVAPQPYRGLSGPIAQTCAVHAATNPPRRPQCRQPEGRPAERSDAPQPWAEAQGTAATPWYSRPPAVPNAVSPKGVRRSEATPLSHGQKPMACPQPHGTLHALWYTPIPMPPPLPPHLPCRRLSCRLPLPSSSRPFPAVAVILCIYAVVLSICRQSRYCRHADHPAYPCQPAVSPPSAVSCRLRSPPCRRLRPGYMAPTRRNQRPH